ncbi:MAG: hypothetical protein LUQ69_05220 [Methanoregulaceae archaeon]|nr:hypothetical protein [Methanoregulaceae archaeon]
MCPIGFGNASFGEAIDLAAVNENIAKMCPLGTGGLTEVDTFDLDPSSAEQAAAPAQTLNIDQQPPPDNSKSVSATSGPSVAATQGSTAKVRDLLAKARSAACTSDD